MPPAVWLVQGESTPFHYSYSYAPYGGSWLEMTQGLPTGITFDPADAGGGYRLTASPTASRGEFPVQVTATWQYPTPGSVTKTFLLVVTGIDGSLDPSFGQNGFVDLKSAFDGIAQGPNGAMIVWSGNPTHQSAVPLVVERLLPSGALDPAFGANGVVDLSELYTISSSAFAVASDGRIAVEYSADAYGQPAPDAGGAPDAGHDLGVMFLAADGTLTKKVSIDPTLGPCTGLVWTGNSVATWSTDSSNTNVLVTVDTTTDQVVTTPFLQIDDVAPRMAASASGAIFLGLLKTQAVAKLVPSGTPGAYAIDATFGTAGIAPIPAWPPTAITVDGAGRVLVAFATINHSFGILRFLPDGTVDAAFGSSGSASQAVPSWFDAGTSVSSGVLVDPTWSTILVLDKGMARFSSDGGIVSTFGDLGFASGTAPAAFDTNAQLWQLTASGGAPPSSGVVRYRIVAP